MDDYEDGVLPAVCASSGEPSDRLYHSHLRHSPLWPLLFLVVFPFGIIVTVVLCLVLSRQADGFLPYSDAVQRRMRQSMRAGWIVSGVGVAVAALALYGLSVNAIQRAFVVFLVLGVLTAIGGLFRVSFPAGSVGGMPDRNGRWITLRHVSRGFADAYDAQEQRRRAERRAERDAAFTDRA